MAGGNVLFQRRCSHVLPAEIFNQVLLLTFLQYLVYQLLLFLQGLLLTQLLLYVFCRKHLLIEIEKLFHRQNLTVVIRVEYVGALFVRIKLVLASPQMAALGLSVRLRRLAAVGFLHVQATQVRFPAVPQDLRTRLITRSHLIRKHHIVHPGLKLFKQVVCRGLLVLDALITLCDIH